MQPTSPLQFDAVTTNTIPALEEVRDDVWALGLDMDGEHIPFSLLYLLRDADDALHVVDPGTDSPANFARVQQAVEALGSTLTDVRTITVTHLHPDHLGMAARLRDASGAALATSATEAEALAHLADTRLTPADVTALADAWGVPADRRAELLGAAGRAPDYAAPHVDRTYVDGEALPIPGFALTAVVTPGHTPGHLCLRDEARSLVFTGDHILPTMFAGLGLGGPTATNPLADYVAGCERVAEFDDHEVLPGHGYRFTGLGERARESAAHHLRRTAEVEGALASHPDASIWEIASQLTWTAGFANLVGFYLYSALSQTAMHREYVRQRQEA